jgi:outer membrane protein OmpA-like peptidoglycan-associated protein
MVNKRLLILLPVLGIFIISLAAGCGASKSYVDQAVAEQRARSEAAVEKVSTDVAANKAEIDRLKSLAQQIEKKADMAINEAKGYENYQIVWEGDIYFNFNSSKITTEAQSTLDQAGDKMTTSKGSIMDLAGYCDPTGSDAYNMALGAKRSQAAKYYLVDNFGLNLYRFFDISYGKRKAVPTNEGNTSYAKQRKVHMRIWGKP